MNQMLSAKSAHPIEVMNFAITGYGPNQYADVIQKYAPVYKPDLIMVQIFVNDYGDVAVTDDEFREAVGFQLPPPNSMGEYLRLQNLRQFLVNTIGERLNEFLTGVPNALGLQFGNFAAFERQQTTFETRKSLVKQRLDEIQTVAKQINANLMLVMVPASIQVCAPFELPYFPRYIDIDNKDQFDLDLPQRNTKGIADELGIKFYDLRPILTANPSGCPYQPANMHWLPVGHQTVAEYLSGIVLPNPG
jgi:hypothetical protein